MDDIVRAALRGWDLLMAAALTLLIGGVAWTGLNLVTASLLAGPALVGLFAVALKAHQGRSADPADLFVAFDDPAAPLLAGVVFVLPFRLADFLGDLSAGSASAGLPLVVPVALAAWFALGMHVFAVLADRPELGLGGAVREAWSLAERPGRGARWSGLARHLGYGIAVFLLVAVARAVPVIGGLTLVVTLPAAVCLLAAWHAQACAPSEAPALGEGAAPAAEPEKEEETAAAAPARRAKPRAKTASRRGGSSRKPTTPPSDET